MPRWPARYILRIAIILEKLEEVYFALAQNWLAPSKWSNPDVGIGFGFERCHAALPNKSGMNAQVADLGLGA